jgi:hypothetical protein
MLNDTTDGVISVWIGTTSKSIDDFNAYTKDMEVLDSGSPIQRDFGCSFVDSDFFVAYGTADNEVVPVEQICAEIDCSRSTEERIVDRCK